MILSFIDRVIIMNESEKKSEGEIELESARTVEEREDAEQIVLENLLVRPVESDLADGGVDEVQGDFEIILGVERHFLDAGHFGGDVRELDGQRIGLLGAYLHVVFVGFPD